MYFPEPRWDEPSKRWHAKKQIRGKRENFYSSTPGLEGKRECREKMRLFCEEGFSFDIRVGEAFQQLLEQDILISHENFLTHRGHYNNHIKRFLEHKKITDTSPQDWQKVINYAFTEKKLSKASLCNLRATIKSFYKFCRKSRYWMIDPSDFLDIPSGAEVGKRTILQPSDIRTLANINAAEEKEHYLFAFIFCLFTGMREGELLGLQEIDEIAPNVFKINRSVSRRHGITSGKTENANRVFKLIPYAITVRALQKNMLKQKGIISPWLFPAPDGNHANPETFYKHWVKFRDKYGISCTIHELRHTFYSVNRNDVPDPLLKKVFGHSENMDSNGHYGHHVEGEDQRAADLIYSVFNNILSNPK